MTVCIAAMCGPPGTIFGAADRMKTAGDVQFEPPSPKIVPLTSSIAIMTAGDAAFQGEIIQEVYKVVYDRIRQEPTNWWRVKDVADLYAHFRSLIKLKRAENRVLTPLGLDRNSFIARQNEMSADFISKITSEMVNFDMPDVAVIITGSDAEGSHIYVVDNENVSCWNPIGFAAIGSGSRHADSQFMMAGHSWNSSVPNTLLLTYMAKKRSEVAPGVGTETDMFIIERRLGSFTFVGDEAIKKLDGMYGKIKKGEHRTIKKANEEINSYVQELEREAAAQRQEQAVQETDGRNEPVDGAALPVGPEEG